MSNPVQFNNVTIISKANIYFDGKVVSHTVLFTDSSKKTIGLIYPGSFKFNTGAPEKMEIISGSCKVKLPGDSDWKVYEANSFFKVPGNSYFEIMVESEITEYVCSFE